ncbi:type IV pilus modification PilV family protein [Methylophaga sp. OBS3]|uniref:type IV pilus modification PilV family protein n=1 Tax=Methylophaga sp. OBS3 TaxID=2991934 RepID=UPI002258A29D|nr:prepilin-type N-terminal cleavage/methylation domain-containing protein [Methylophaga sp. OBS3]MCX4190366.1 prepilin-type N-terminal cleavage/methylation domain-containing protein [Methylophaga sp. OBS3]
MALLQLKKHNNGFSLVEVMVALVILGLGMVALIKFQGELITNATEAKELSEAYSVAEQTMEVFRSFENLQTFAAIDDGTYEAPYPAPFDNANADILQLDQYNNAYEVSWVVSDCFGGGVRTVDGDNNDIDQCLDGFGETAPAGWQIGGANGQMYKIVQVNIDWDRNNDGDTTNDDPIILLSAIESTNFQDTALPPTNGDASDIAGDSALTRDTLSDEVQVNVDTGSGEKRQAGKPLPEVVASGQRKNTLVAFDVITYSPINNSNEVNVNLREEFLNVACECRINSTSAVGYTPGHVQWNTSGSYRYDAVNNTELKTTAVPTGDNAADVEGLCTICCRDHHDGNGPVRYDGQIGVTGNHPHYDDNGNAVSAVGAIYTESCRFKRIDGVFRAFQDWQLQAINILPNEQLLNNASLEAAYSSYVGDYIIPDNDVTTFADVEALIEPVVIPVGGTGVQLQARGIYLDNVYAIDGSLSTGAGSYAVYDGEDKLEQTPFAEVNLTLLADWDALNIRPPDEPNLPDYFSDPEFLNEDLATIDVTESYFGNLYRRGIARGLEETPQNGAPWPVYASIESGTDGITDNSNTEIDLVLSLNGTNPNDPDPVNKKFSRFDVAVLGAASSYSVTGTISFTGLPGNNLKPVGTAETPFCGLISSGNSNTYSCIVPDGQTFTFNVSFLDKNGTPYSCTSTGNSNSFTINGANISRNLSFTCQE